MIVEEENKLLEQQLLEKMAQLSTRLSLQRQDLIECEEFTKRLESARLENMRLKCLRLESMRKGPKVKAPSCAELNELQKQEAAGGWGARHSTEGFGLLILRLAQTLFPTWPLPTDGEQH